MKKCKTPESFCFSILTIYTTDWLQLIGYSIGYMFTAAMFISYSSRFLNICKPRITFNVAWWAGSPGLGLHGSGPVCLLD